MTTPSPAAARCLAAGLFAPRADRLCCLCLLLAPTLVHADMPAAPPRTTAEKSDYKETSRHADVVAFCEALSRQSDTVRLDTLGTTHEGRKVPLLVLADPPVSRPSQAGKRAVVLCVGNIHAGEVDGKEALLMLARDLAAGEGRGLLKDLVVLVVPNLNADGNEKLSKKNRQEQNGPAEVGTRANAQGLDLNRDFVKLETPEVRALVGAINTWDPAVVLDMHTTNGSFHRYAVTYDGPRNPAGDARVSGLAREVLTAVGKRMLERNRLDSYFYGNFSRDHKRWMTYPALPRFGVVYLGLRNRLALLCESYSYDPFKGRVRASRSFARSALEHVARGKERIRRVLSGADERVVRGGKKPRGDDRLALRFRASALKGPATVRGFVEERKDGRRINTGKPRDYEVELMLHCEPTLEVTRPFAYLFPASLANVAEVLQRHGVEVEELREEAELNVEVYRLGKLSRELIAYQKHNLLRVETTPRKATRRVPAGTYLVRTAQPLGTLAAYLLEPQSDDGLVAWNAFDAVLAEGKDFPVLRLPAPASITSGKVRR
jgi:hypothetical protein